MISEPRQPAHTRLRAIATPFAALALFALAFAVAVPCDDAHAADAPKTDEEKAFYSIGLGYGTQLKSLGTLTDAEVELVVRGLRDGMTGAEPAVSRALAQGLIRKVVERRQKEAMAAEKEAGAAFAAEQAKRKGAKTTESGLVLIETKAGTGASPTPKDKVRVHYHGTFRDGEVFDSSVDRGEPAEFPLNGVIPCWTEGVAMMKVGGKATLICPPKIAYGERGNPRIPGGTTLRFEVELLDIVK